MGGLNGSADALHLKALTVISDDLDRLLLKPLVEVADEIKEFLFVGGTNSRLREMVSIADMRSIGAFFTGDDMAQRLLEEETIDVDDIVFDPTCGSGDLLIAASRKMALRKSLQETLLDWEGRLFGRDLHPEFVSIAKRRLILEAKSRHSSDEAILGADSYFKNICAGDSLLDAPYAEADLILLNPPYGRKALPVGLSWASGKTTLASLFVIKALENMSLGSRLLAILPEALRSGTNSAKWREEVSLHSDSGVVRVAGLFDKDTDIDVFFLGLNRNNSRGSGINWGVEDGLSEEGVVGDYFDVHVGPVVPHRDPERGAISPLFDVRNVGPWDKDSKSLLLRRFGGRLFSGPFVLVRRTSRPGQSYRAVASCVRDVKGAAVENHLIICTPKDRTVASCLYLMRLFKSQEANRWFDKRIRCRHLTVSAVKKMPYKHRR